MCSSDLADIGYGLVGDIGGPMLPSEAYRWNKPVISYAFDRSFLLYFGPNGVAEIEKAMAILNALPDVSQMSSDLSEFPLSTRLRNHTAAALSLTDLKSIALSVMLEELGLANPERFTWTLRSKTTFPTHTNYAVVKYNYDPATKNPSSYVNGALYTYRIKIGRAHV